MPVVIAAWAAALVLAGAPAGATYTCDSPLVDSFGALGFALIAERQVILGTRACAALLLAGMTPLERAQTQRLNPRVALGRLQGGGLLVVLHEARHLTGETNECRVETFALAHVGALIRRFVPTSERAVALAAAARSDAQLGAAYHEGCE